MLFIIFILFITHTIYYLFIIYFIYRILFPLLKLVALTTRSCQRRGGRTCGPCPTENAIRRQEPLTLGLPCAPAPCGTPQPNVGPSLSSASPFRPERRTQFVCEYVSFHLIKFGMRFSLVVKGGASPKSGATHPWRPLIFIERTWHLSNRRRGSEAELLRYTDAQVPPPVILI